jgi:N-acetylmuramoyl-L-alanine amidase
MAPHAVAPMRTIRKVIIDPGHGGKDPGAVGKKSKEKDIVLSVGLKLGAYIKQNFPEVEVIYTRKTDEFIELYRRASIANNAKADLFISIHCNANRNATPIGSETWVMGLHKSQENLQVAKKENASILLEDNYKQRYDGFDPNSPEGHILFSLYQNTYLSQSLDFAAFVQEEFRERLKRIDRGVKQAGFLVLAKSAMPSVLIELGFLSNPSEEAYLVTEKGKNEFAMSIFKAFRRYKYAFEGVALSSREEGIVEPEVIADTNIPVVLPGTQEKPAEPEVYFSVQIATSSRKKSSDAPEFKGVKDVWLYEHGGVFKYVVGKEPSLMAAMEVQHEMQTIGFKDAFVVAFHKGERISPREAVDLLNK